jgi:hypothetical protein
MTCSERDTDLLLLAHGEGDLWRRLGTLIHLWRCASCRQRYRDFTAVSALLAKATQPVVGTSAPFRGMAFGMRPAIAIAVLLLATLLFAASLLAAHYGNGGVSCQRLPPGGATKSKMPCAPDLPNDHCR